MYKGSLQKVFFEKLGIPSQQGVAGLSIPSFYQLLFKNKFALELSINVKMQKETSLGQNSKFFPKSFLKASPNFFEILKTPTKNDPRWMGALISQLIKDLDLIL